MFVRQARLDGSLPCGFQSERVCFHRMSASCHCGCFAPEPLTRREMLLRCANGFGAVALAALLGDKTFAGTNDNPGTLGGSLAPRPPHFPAKARNVIFLYMDGGPSQVDTFDPKPRLQSEHGKPFKMKMEP